MAVDVGLAVCTDSLCHVGQWHEGLFCHVDITVFANDVGAVQKGVIDMYVACDTLATHDDAEVLVGNLLLGHVLVGEVDHHGQGTVHNHVD